MKVSQGFLLDAERHFSYADILRQLHSNKNCHIALSVEDCEHVRDLDERKIYLDGPIEPVADGCDNISGMSTAVEIVRFINYCNDRDRGAIYEQRKPIWLFINSPGGDVTEGFAVVDAILLSRTPVYTVNIGLAASIAFLILISGYKRFSFPHATFLLHEGSGIVGGSIGKMQDHAKFNERFENEVIRDHVLSHSKMSAKKYDSLARVEHYMLPKDALHQGFIDKIIESLDDV